MSRPWLRFVVLRHEGIDPPHYDLMVETVPGSALATWRSPVWPLSEGVDLLRLADHRRDYLEYEGAISGGRGRVRRVAAGRCRLDVSGSESDGATGRRSGLPPVRWLITFDAAGVPGWHVTLEECGEGVWRAWLGSH